MSSCKELLLILVVSGLLISVGASVLNFMSAAEKKAVCASHLKEVARMGFQYQSDHNGEFQPMIVRKRTWIYWPQYLKEYCRDFIHFSCPSDTLRGAGAFEMDELLPRSYQPGYISYGMNYFLSDSGEKHMKNWPCNINAVANLSYVVYFGDSRTLQLRPTVSCWKDDYYPVHEGKSVNLVMLDGHVENHTSSSLGMVHEFDNWRADHKRWIDWRK